MLFDGIEYAWTRKVRMMRKSTTAAAMDLIHSSSSFLGGAPAFSFTGAERARAAVRVWGVGTVLMRAGCAPPGGGAVRISAGRRVRTSRPGPPEYALWSLKFPNRNRSVSRRAAETRRG